MCICICSEVVLLIWALCKVVYFWQWQEMGGDLLQQKMWPIVTGHTRAFHKSPLMVKGKIHQYFGLPFPWTLMRSWRLFLPSNLKLTIGSNLLVCFQVRPSLWVSEGFKVTANLSALMKKTKIVLGTPSILLSSLRLLNEHNQKCHVCHPAARGATQTRSRKHPLPHLEWGRKK